MTEAEKLVEQAERLIVDLSAEASGYPPALIQRRAANLIRRVLTRLTAPAAVDVGAIARIIDPILWEQWDNWQHLPPEGNFNVSGQIITETQQEVEASLEKSREILSLFSREAGEYEELQETIEDLRTQLAALQPRRAEDEWRPIGEAPRDGTTFLAFIIGSGWWEVASWNGECFENNDGFETGELTHWQHLPAPPRASEEG